MLIVFIAGLLLCTVIVFPPYIEYDVDKNGRLIGDHTRWRLNELITEFAELKGHKYSIQEHSPVRREIAALEVVGILVISLFLWAKAKKK